MTMEGGRGRINCQDLREEKRREETGQSAVYLYKNQKHYFKLEMVLRWFFFPP